VNHLTEAEDHAPTTISKSDFSGGAGADLLGVADSFNYSFEQTYEIDSSNLGVEIRVATTGEDISRIEFFLNNNSAGVINQFDMPTGGFSTQWFTIAKGTSFSLSKGNVTVDVEVTNVNSENVYLDLISVYDTRYNLTFDDTVDTNNALDGPELYTNLTTQALTEVTDGQYFDGVRLVQDWNNTDNGQDIKVTNSASGNFIQESNQQTLEGSFTTDTKQATTEMTFSRFDDDTTTTPTTGDGGQTIDRHELFADINAISATDTGLADVAGLVESGTITGTTLREVGQRDGNGDLLTRVTFAEFDVTSNTSVKSSEQISWDNA
jgi:hypothetical protein